MSSRISRARRARKGDRSFQPSSAGKGHQSRIDDMESFRRNFDEIDWGPGKRILKSAEQALSFARGSVSQYYRDLPSTT